MNPTKQRAEQLFIRALECPHEERPAFLADACGDDLALRQRLDALLAAHDQAGGFLPAEDHGRTTVPGENPPTHIPESLTDESAGTLIGRFKLLEKLGEGGFGSVWLAEQKQPVRRKVALKIVKLGMDTRQVVARFEAERQALALMDHPNIAKIFDAGITGEKDAPSPAPAVLVPPPALTGRPYFVMELVRGIPITTFCDENRLPIKERLGLFITVCHAIQHAHQKGIIHRDIKPSNILVTLHDGVPVPKVIDFGIAKATQQELTDKTIHTSFQQFIGTPAYMSPEQAEMSGLDIDTRSDIYSLGVLLYELLTGSTPFDTKQLMRSGLDELRRIIREQEPMRPSTRLSQLQASTTHTDPTTLHRRKNDSIIDRDLDWIALKCLEKDRTRRYETANGLAMDVKRHLNNEPVVARPPSPGYRLRKAWMRNRVAYTATSAVALAILVGGLASVWQAGVAQRARTAAESASRTALDNARKAEQQRELAVELSRRAEQRQIELFRRAYASDLNLAHQSVKNNNIGRALELLGRYQPQPGRPDPRGWEWRYLWGLCRSDAAFELNRFDDSLVATALSPDGAWVAFGGQRGLGIRLWSLRDRREIGAFGQGEYFCHVAFSPDGKWLAGSSVKRLWLWDCIDQRVTAEAQVERPIVSLGYSGDGQKLITYSEADAITIRNAADLGIERVLKAPVGHAWLGTPFAFSKDFKTAIRIDGLNTITAVDLASGKELWKVSSDKGFSQAIAISPDGRWVACSFSLIDGTIRILDMNNGQQIATLPGHRAWVSSLLFWPDGSKLASASADQTIAIWDLTTFQRLRTLRGHEQEVWSLALSSDGHTLVSGGKDGTAFVWDATRDTREPSHWQLPGKHDAWMFAQDADAMLSFNADTGKAVRLSGPKYEHADVLLDLGRAPLEGSQNWPSISFSPSGQRLAVTRNHGQLQVWNIAERRIEAELALGPLEIQRVVFARQENKLWLVRQAAAARDQSDVEEWDLTSGKRLRSIPNLRSPIRIAADQWVFGTVDSKSGLLYDLTSGQSHRRTMFQSQPVAPYASPTSSPDGSLLVLVLDAGLLTLWDVARLKSNSDLNPSPAQTVGGVLMSFFGASFSADGTRLYGCSHGSEAIKIWDTAAYEELLTLAAETEGFRQAVLSPSGRDLAAVGGPNKLYIWRAASSVDQDLAQRK